MKALFVLLGLVFIISSGCNKNEEILTQKPEENIEIIPLEIGNTWIFQVTIYDTSANIISTKIDTTIVISDTLINGSRYFIFPPHHMRWNNEFGYWFPYSNAGNMDSSLIYKYPAEVGEQFGFGLIVVNKDTSISVPSGTFKCYSYKSQVAINYVAAINFVAPGIGLIKEELYKKKFNSFEYVYQKSELISYNIIK